MLTKTNNKLYKKQEGLFGGIENIVYYIVIAIVIIVLLIVIEKLISGSKKNSYKTVSPVLKIK